jgi:uncharacterized phage protein (TIGR01671 family)
MNRTIKFHGKRVDNGEWVEGFYILDGLNSRIFELGKTSLTNTGVYSGVEVIPETVTQFTGLLDKNGKEIYEGDFLQIGSSSFGWVKNGYGKTVAYEVKLEGCDYILYRSDLNLTWGRLSRLDEIGWTFEIIGNIHNPELLNNNR